MALEQRRRPILAAAVDEPGRGGGWSNMAKRAI
jgi:hypothetical protein